MLDDAPHSASFAATRSPSGLAQSTAGPDARQAVQHAARALWSGPHSSEQIRDARLRRLARVIEATPDDWSAIRRGIESTHLSAAYLSVRFREALGMPMRSFALWMKFELACALVLEGRSAGDAAVEAGFADQSHMGRAARRFAGKSFKRALSDLKEGLSRSTGQIQQGEAADRTVRPANKAVQPPAPSSAPMGAQPDSELRRAV